MQAVSKTLSGHMPLATEAQKAEVTKRYSRRVVVTRTSEELLISFSWRDTEEHNAIYIHNTFFTYPLCMSLDTVLEALAVFMSNGFIEYHQDERTILMSPCVDHIAGKFDMVANSEEPAQTLISRYVL